MIRRKKRAAGNAAICTGSSPSSTREILQAPKSHPLTTEKLLTTTSQKRKLAQHGQTKITCARTSYAV
jgi:hypothetical protein